MEKAQIMCKRCSFYFLVHEAGPYRGVSKEKYCLEVGSSDFKRKPSHL